MAVTKFQAEILRRIARLRIAGGETYVAGGLALNHALGGARISRDIDVFNDTEEALRSAVEGDAAALRAAGFEVRTVRETAAFTEATVSRGGETTAIQWARDSAYRFFPLVEDELLGATLHPFDLATNKLLALAGRREPRDWVDMIRCHERLQGLGYLAWAACGKDPGYSPASLLEWGARIRYAQEELDLAVVSEEPPDAASLGRRWHEAVAEGRRTVALLPAESAGTCVMDGDGGLFRGGEDDLAKALAEGRVRFHRGSIRGAWPRALRARSDE